MLHISQDKIFQLTRAGHIKTPLNLLNIILKKKKTYSERKGWKHKSHWKVRDKETEDKLQHNERCTDR